MRTRVHHPSRWRILSVLFGWYFLVPPFTHQNLEFDSAAPISSWEQLGAYNTAMDCEMISGEMIKSAEKAHNKVRAARLIAGRCTSTEDPGLKDWLSRP